MEGQMTQAPKMMWDQILTLARDNDAASIRELCRLGCPPSHGNRIGQTALHIAAMWGSIEAVKTLLECGADANAANQLRGSRPLHAAAMGKGPPEKRAECIKIMLAGGADKNLADLGGELPIDCADGEALRLALGAAPLILHKAVQTKNSSALAGAIKQILTGSVSLTLEDPNPLGDTALHHAVLVGWQEGVEHLLLAGATAVTQNNARQSPLHAAVISGDHRMVGVLVNAKADVNVQDRDEDHDPRFSSNTFKTDPWKHRSPLHYAAELGNLLVAKSLLEAAADPNHQDSKMETPFHLCLSSLKSDDVSFQHGCGVRIHSLLKRPEWNDCLGSVFGPAPESGGGYPTGGGAAQRWPVLLETGTEGVLLKEDNLQLLSGEMVDLLLHARADVNLGNQVIGETRTALHEAARLGDAALLQKVVAARADVDRKDAKLGFTALHLAARSKHHDAIAILVEARADLLQTTSGGKSAAELAETNGAAPATLALLRGSEAPPTVYAVPEAAAPQTLEGLTAEQRAMLFID